MVTLFAFDCLYLICPQRNSQKQDYRQPSHSGNTVTQKPLTVPDYCITLIAIGRMQVFDLHGRPKASRVYAWPHDADGQKERHLTVLHVAPITSAVEAVRAAIVQEFRTLESEN